MQVKDSPETIIRRYQETRIDLVMHHKDVAQSQAGTEAESSKDYVGRVAFEFFQNAVDRADRHIWMKLTKESFTVMNDGQEFTIFEGERKNKKSDFHSLNTIHNGDKVAGESIGNKGVGFKSCWNVSNHVQIESINDGVPWGFELFNPVKIEDFESTEIKKAIQMAGGKAPSFYFPKYLECKEKKFDNEIVTLITINFNREDAYEEIKNELEEFKQTKFIFLNLLKDKSNKEYEIHISIDGKEESFNSKDEEWRVFTLKEEEQFKEEFEILKESRGKENYENIPKEPNIAIAFPPDNKDIGTNSKFYTYLPTKAKCGFNVLIHADFALDNARKHIPDNQYNDKILEIAAKMFVHILLSNEELHSYNDFAKFLLPVDKNNKFAKFVWKELMKDDRLSEILKKVFFLDSNFPQESYETIFYVISKWQKEKTKRNWGAHYDEVYDSTLKYFCDPEIFIVWIDDNNKTFLPSRKRDNTYEYKLFYRESKESSGIDLSLLREFETIKITNFEPIGRDLFTHNKIVRKFSTVEILKSLKQYENSKIIRFIYQLMNRTDEELSDSVKEQLSEIKIPIGDGGFAEVKKCYVNIDKTISDTFSDEFREVGLRKTDDEIGMRFLAKIGVADNRLPFYTSQKKVVLPFKDGMIFPKSNMMKELVSNSLPYLDQNTITELGKVAWFYDERKNELYSPDEVFLFKDHDNRKIACIAQEKKRNSYSALYAIFGIEEIDDTVNIDKICKQLEMMKELIIDGYHQDIYKKLTYQLAKIYDKNEKLAIPIMVIPMQDGDVTYVDNSEKIIFLETKHKMYKEELKEVYEYLGYFDTNIKHSFLQKYVGIKVFNPNYTIEYKDGEKRVEPTVDSSLKSMLENEFLTPFFAIANEVLGSKFEKDDAIKRWENLTINKAKNVILTITDSGKNTIVVGSTQQSDIDVLYIPIKDRQNNPTIMGEVAHDLRNPEQNPNLRKFAQVFAEGIFRNQKLKSDYELYITAYLNKDENLKNEILRNKGIEDSHMIEMNSFIVSNLLTDDEKNEIKTKINEIGVPLDDYSQWRDFTRYEALECSFEDFKSRFDEKFTPIIENFISEYKQYIRSKIVNEIGKKGVKEELQVLCFKSSGGDRDKFDKRLKIIKQKEISAFQTETDPFTLFEVQRLSKSSDEYIEAFLDYKNYTDRVQNKKFDFLVEKNSLEAKNSPNTGDASNSDKEKNFEREKLNETIGIGQELKVSYGWAKKIPMKDKFIAIIKQDIYANDEELRGNKNFVKYIEALDNYKNSDNLSFAENVIQIASNNLDGLGYDLVVPEFDESGNEIIGIKKVELKTTTRPNNIEIHFSRNEIERIIHYMDVDNWEIWLNDQENNITEIVKESVKELSENFKDSPFYFQDYILKLGVKS